MRCAKSSLFQRLGVDDESVLRGKCQGLLGIQGLYPCVPSGIEGLRVTPADVSSVSLGVAAAKIYDAITGFEALQMY